MGWDDYKSIHIVFRTDGLCARLRSLSGAATAANYLEKPLTVRWLTGPACPANLDEVLVDSFQLADGAKLDAFRVNKVVPPCAKGQDYHQIVKHLVDKDEFIATMRALRKEWRPVQSVQDRLDEIEEEHGPLSKMIGVHIRRTDMLPWLEKDGFVPHNDEWVRAIRSAARTTKTKIVYLATCCGVTSRIMQGMLKPLKVVRGVTEFDTTRKGEHRQTSMEDAVLDLYALSKCGALIGTPRSSFSRYAASLRIGSGGMRVIKPRRASSCRGKT